MFAIVPTAQDGIVFRGDWDNLGQRLTDSGSVEINDVEVDWASAAGFVDKEFQPLVYNTLNFPAIEIVFANFYLGIARGALDTAAEYTRTRTRPWPYGGDNREIATDEWYLREGYGDLQSKLWAAEAFVDQVSREADAVLHDARENLTEQARGDLAVRIAAAKTSRRRRLLGDQQQDLRTDRCQSHVQRCRPGYLLAQHPDAYPSRSARVQAP